MAAESSAATKSAATPRCSKVKPLGSQSALEAPGRNLPALGRSRDTARDSEEGEGGGGMVKEDTHGKEQLVKVLHALSVWSLMLLCPLILLRT